MGEKSDKNRFSLVHFEANFWYLAEIGKYVSYRNTYKSISCPLGDFFFLWLNILLETLKLQNYLQLCTSYLTDLYNFFTLKMESVPDNIISDLKMMVKSGLEKIIL